jgi:AP endonuclease-2
MRGLLSCGRNVLLVGDLNISPYLADVCHQDASDFNDERSDRLWLRGHLAPPPRALAAAAAAAAATRQGAAGAAGPAGASAGAAATQQQPHPRSDPQQQQEESAWRDPRGASLGLVDVFRAFHPRRADAFTCWATLTGARATNWGSRIDHILAAPGRPQQQQPQHDAADARGEARQPASFPEWFEWCDILADVEGSDHAPVVADVRVPAGLVAGGGDPPRVACSTHWSLRSQSSLKGWLAKGAAHQAGTAAGAAAAAAEGESRSGGEAGAGAGSASGSQHTSRQLSLPARGQASGSQTSGAGGSAARLGRAPSASGTRGGGGQASMFNFVQRAQRPETAAAGAQPSRPAGAENAPPAAGPAQRRGSSSGGVGSGGAEEEPPLALEGAPSDEQALGQQADQDERRSAARAQWRDVMAAVQRKPRCKGHGEECVIRTVKKPGPTQGKQFYVCARPAGPPGVGRCDYFQWGEGGAPGGGLGGEGRAMRRMRVRGLHLPH